MAGLDTRVARGPPWILLPPWCSQGALAHHRAAAGSGSDIVWLSLGASVATDQTLMEMWLLWKTGENCHSPPDSQSPVGMRVSAGASALPQPGCFPSL